MKKLRVAVIGAGQIARVSHIANYQSFSEVEVAAICDTNLEAAKKTAKEFKIPLFFENYLEMLKQVKPDAVSICVPNRFHSEITCAALENGCHVFCEKPPAITLEEAIKMEQTAKKYHRLLTFGFHFRHASHISFIKQKIQKGDFGEIYKVNVQWIRRRGIPGWGNFINKELQGGGPLIDIGSHMLDLAVYLMGYKELDYVCATSSDKIGKKGTKGLMGNWNPEKFSVEDGLFGFLKFKNGACIQLETAFALNQKEKDTRNVQLFGDKMGVSLFPFETFGQEEERLINTTYPFEEECDLHYKAIENFIFSCFKKEELLVTAKQAVYLQTLICALYDSAQKGKPVIIE